VPDTGDNNHLILWVLLAGFSVIGLVVLVVPFRKKGRYCA
jgi:LPXTG-motif cell wall-anchored protein